MMWRRRSPGRPRVVSEEQEARRVAAAVARDTVSAVAPGELVLFDVIAAEYFRDPERTLAGRRPRDEVLGYGPGDVVELVTPAALAVAAAIVGAVADRAGATIVESAARAARRLVRGLRGRSAPAARTRRRRKLPEDLIVPFTDAFVASLIAHWSADGRAPGATGTAGTGERRPGGTGEAPGEPPVPEEGPA